MSVTHAWSGAARSNCRAKTLGAIGNGCRDCVVTRNRRRRPPQGLLHHSDRGSQYASGDYQRVLAQYGIVCSMSRRGDCWDNAVAESFFATLKVELVHDAAWATRAAARTELFEYLELFYNGQRRHSALGYLSPRAFERRREQEAVAT